MILWRNYSALISFDRLLASIHGSSNVKSLVSAIWRGFEHRIQRVRAGPTAIWLALNSLKIVYQQYYIVINILKLNYNVL
jgi:hypothetical protein